MPPFVLKVRLLGNDLMGAFQISLSLILSPTTQAAFDLSREPSAMHERYGRSEMGQVLLLSRRLIEAGVRFVTANAVSNPENTTLSAFQICHWTDRSHTRR